MLHVATDKASTPPAFTRSPSFPPFFLPIYWIHARQSAAMVRRLYSNLLQLQSRPAVVGAGLAHICAGAGQLIGGAELMCRRGMASDVLRKNRRPAIVGASISKFFVCTGEEGLLLL